MNNKNSQAHLTSVIISHFNHFGNKPEGWNDTQGPTVTEVVTGGEVAFMLKYRGITGKADDLNSYGGYGFGSVKEADTPFGLWTVLVIHG